MVKPQSWWAGYYTKIFFTAKCYFIVADGTLTTDNTEDEDAEDDSEIRLYEDPSLIEFINTCTASEMLSLPNINEEKAETILAKRPYENLDQLVWIKVYKIIFFNACLLCFLTFSPFNF